MATDQLVVELRQQGKVYLNEVEAKELLSKAGVRTTRTLLATSRDEAIGLARQIGFPVALKVISPDIVHKSDIGGVRLGLAGEEQVGAAYDAIMAAVREKEPGANVTGISVQEMARPGVEVIIGMAKDPNFGPVLMFGLGGVLVELLKDVSFRLAPITRFDAHEMITEVKGYPLLQGYRGQEPANLELLEEMLLKVSAFVEANPSVKELDLNPVFASRDDAVAVDARIILESESQ